MMYQEYSSALKPGPPALYKGEPFDYQVIGDPKLVPPGFPETLIANHGMSLPANWLDMIVVVDGLVGWGVSEEDTKEAETVKRTLKTQKSKKRNVSFPEFDDPPKILKEWLCYRYIVMYRDTRTPILFIGFDEEIERLNSGFWVKALDLKSRVHNPKSAKPTGPKPT